MNRFVFLLVATTLFPSAAVAQQCVNPAKPNCDFYDKCMEATCKCGFTADGYAVSYGLKYCRRFLSEADLTPQGQKWRDSTLRCLQETLVAALPQNPAGCNCATLRDQAYASHVTCYAQKGASICDLPETDVLKLKDLVDDSDKTDANGIKALVQLAVQCIASNPSNSWKLVKAYALQKLGK